MNKHLDRAPYFRHTPLQRKTADGELILVLYGDLVEENASTKAFCLDGIVAKIFVEFDGKKKLRDIITNYLKENPIEQDSLIKIICQILGELEQFGLIDYKKMEDPI